MLRATDVTSKAARDLPLYAKIAEELRAQITDGSYGPGALLPSRNELAGVYSVTAITARDALAVLSQEGLAQAIRDRSHIVRRKRPRLNAPGRLYAPGEVAGTTLDPAVLLLRDVDVYQEVAPDNIALPLGSGADLVWVRRAVFIAAADRWPAQIQVSWLPGLTASAGDTLRGTGQELPWPQAVQQVTSRAITTVQQKTRARREPARSQGIRSPGRRPGAGLPPDHVRPGWPAGRAFPVHPGPRMRSACAETTVTHANRVPQIAQADRRSTR
jgi:DNA-binding GntR family transcriptional regulator